MMVLVAGATRSYSGGRTLADGYHPGVFLLSSAMAVKLRWPDGRPLAAISLTLVGVVVGGGCFSFVVFLWYLPVTATWAGSGLPYLGLLFVAFPLPSPGWETARRISWARVSAGASSFPR
jgi:hypothetical protein